MAVTTRCGGGRAARRRVPNGTSGSSSRRCWKRPGGASASRFAVIDQSIGKGIGWTTYLDIDVRNERLEIGWTRYGRACWRTGVNTEVKVLLMSHAFEELGMGRVQWKTDQGAS